MPSANGCDSTVPPDDNREMSEFLPSSNIPTTGTRLSSASWMAGLYFIPALIDQWKAKKTNAAFLNFFSGLAAY
jgi:hypothetical protein